MRRKHTLRARTGPYTDRQTGREKQGYMTVGYVLEKPDGSQAYKIDSLPVNFDGWLFIGDLPSRGANQALQAKDAAAEQTQQGFSDDVPF